MARGEIYVQLSANYADDPTVRKLLRYGPDARGLRDLFVQMICYSKLTMTDGFIPAEQVGVMCYPDSWENAQRDAARLVEVGLIEAVDDGYHMPSFLKRNKSRNQIEAEASAKSHAAKVTNHSRWHEGKGKIDPKCPLCIGIEVAPAITSAIAPRVASGVASDSTETETETETEAETETVKNKNSAPPSRPARRKPDLTEFAEFWSAYPIKKARPAAEKAWAKAVAKAPAHSIIAAAANYRDDPARDPQFTAHPATWLNQERWGDERTPAGRRIVNGHLPYQNPTDQSVYDEEL